jgi:transcription elongation factor Elf1
MVAPYGYRCPSCGSEDLASIQSTALDSELLECQACKLSYEVKYGPDGKARLVAV